MTLISSMALAILGGLVAALAAVGGIRAAWRNCEGRRGVFAALAILAAICSIVAQKPSPDTPTITVDALLRDVGCYATNNVFHAAVTNAPSYAGVDFSDCDLMVYARERASTNAASWFELTPRKKFSQQPADYAIENATNYNYMVYLNYVPPSPVHTNGVFELHGFVVPGDEPGNLEQLAAGFINSRAVTIRDLPYDAEVEYLESTGTQYIDTGVYGNALTAAICSWSYRDAQSGAVPFGSRTSVQSKAFAMTGWSTLATKDLYFNFSTKSDYLRYVGNDVYAHKWECRAGQGGSWLKKDGVTVYSNSASVTSFTTEKPILLFGMWGGNSLAKTDGVRIEAFSLYNNNTLVRDYIAVRKSGVGYLYDRVSGQLFGNNGTGAFRVGPDK